MTFQTDAIYEAGVLRPLTPLELEEHQVVSLVVSTTTEDVSPEAKAARQRDILMAYVAKVESRPDDSPQDGYTNRDHDRLIYGK
jgi:predicted DNA-binding antitoxin AbrB/MazE fold protein